MTPLGRIVAPISTAALLSLLVSSAFAADPSERTMRRARFAYVPAAIWGPYLEDATAGVTLSPNAIYWFEGGEDMGRVIGDLERYRADDAKASPRDALVAFVGRYAVYPSNTLQPGVAVMDTAGVLLADFAQAKRYAWSPDGARLAVVYSKTVDTPNRASRPGRGRGGRGWPAPRSPRGGVQIWDRMNGTARVFSQWPLSAAWAGSDSLLLQFADRVVVMNPRTGVVTRSALQGAIVSPDGLYSLRAGRDGMETRISEEGTGDPITTRVFGPFIQRGRSQIRSAFWVSGRGADHLMCVSGCTGIQDADPGCRTRVIDVRTFESVASFGGEALGPTADGRGVILFHRDEGRLEFRSLRGLGPGGREPASQEVEPSAPGEFY